MAHICCSQWKRSLETSKTWRTTLSITPWFSAVFATFTFKIQVQDRLGSSIYQMCIFWIIYHSEGLLHVSFSPDFVILTTEQILLLTKAKANKETAVQENLWSGINTEKNIYMPPLPFGWPKPQRNWSIWDWPLAHRSWYKVRILALPDARNSFLHRDLDEETICNYILDYILGGMRQLRKAIYGLKQSSPWFERFREVVEEYFNFIHEWQATSFYS